MNHELKPTIDFIGKRIHFMGAGGIGVSALMELCAGRGAIVSGCDVSAGGQVADLRNKGFQIQIGHSPNHVTNCDELVYTAAAQPSHPEIQQAKKEGCLTSVRMRMLGRIASGLRAICVTGAHGKTTTTWLIARMLIVAGRDPSALLGGVVTELKGNARIGRGGEFVAEVDESDNRLYEIIPSIPVLTNIDNDHQEHYGSIEAIEAAAARFMASTNTADPLAALIGCGDDLRAQRILTSAGAECGLPIIAYGFGHNCDLQAINLRPKGLGWRFDALGCFGLWREFELPMPGEHNVLNALAAIAVGWRLGLSSECIRRALATIERVARRFEIKGVKSGVRVIDDYGHHPTEIAVTLRAARVSTEKRLGVLFQPHRYTRTAALLHQFADCFNAADIIFLLPVYSAGEEPINGVDHHVLAGAIRAHSKKIVHVVENRDEAVKRALSWVEAGDTLITQGAGDITRAADELVAGL